jgi:hypothetical protein
VAFIRPVRDADIQFSTSTTPPKVKWKTLHLPHTYQDTYLQLSSQKTQASATTNKLHESPTLVILIFDVQILFIISALCFFGILWAAIALARHIRSSGMKNLSDVTQPDFKHHLFSATETFHSISTRIPSTPIQQSVHDISANKQWTLSPRPIQVRRSAIQPVHPVRTTPPARKSPQPARYGPMELLDSAYFNKDMGDLTDPYQPPRLRANDRNRPASPKRS